MSVATIKAPITVTVTGAAGAIGYALLPRIASGQMFGEDQPINLNLLELPQALDALRGVEMELHDCAFPLLNRVTITDDVVAAFSGTDWALLVGSVPRKQGMERSDLLHINAEVFKVQGNALNEHAKKSAKVLVVGNPCNTNALITMNHAPNLDPNHFFAMTMLDENRAVSQLAERAKVPSTDVNINIWGNHSSTLYPDIDNATIQGRPAREVIQDQHWLENDFVQAVQQRGAAIIKARGASSAFSAANGVVDTVRSVCGLNGNRLFSLSLPSNGEYGAEKGLFVSYPCRHQDGKITIENGLKHSDYSLQKIQATFDELSQEAETVRKAGLVS